MDAGGDGCGKRNVTHPRVYNVCERKTTPLLLIQLCGDFVEHILEGFLPFAKLFQLLLEERVGRLFPGGPLAKGDCPVVQLDLERLQ